MIIHETLIVVSNYKWIVKLSFVKFSLKLHFFQNIAPNSNKNSNFISFDDRIQNQQGRQTITNNLLLSI